jgi:hypothetical protein
VIIAGALLRQPTVQARPTTAAAPHYSSVETQTSTGTARRRVDVFARGTDGTLQHRWTAYGSGYWTSWESLGGRLDSAPAVASTGSGQIRVYFRSGDDLWEFILNVCCQYTAITSQKNLGHLPAWAASPWDCLVSLLSNCGFYTHAPLTSAPAVAGFSNGRVDVFAFSGSDWLIHRSWDAVYTSDVSSDGWSDWELLSKANFAGDPGAISWGNGRIDVLVQGSYDNHLYDKVYENGWTNWLDLGGTLTAGPAAASWQPGHMVIFARNQFGGLSARGYWSGYGWYGWSTLDGSFIGPPAVSTWGTATFDVFARSTHNTLLHKWYNGGVWTGWEDLGGSIDSAPAALTLAY